MLERGQLGQLRGEVHQLVVAQVQVLQLREAEQWHRQARQGTPASLRGVGILNIKIIITNKKWGVSRWPPRGQEPGYAGTYSIVDRVLLTDQENAELAPWAAI